MNTRVKQAGAGSGRERQEVAIWEHKPGVTWGYLLVFEKKPKAQNFT